MPATGLEERCARGVDRGGPLRVAAAPAPEDAAQRQERGSARREDQRRHRPEGRAAARATFGEPGARQRHGLRPAGHPGCLDRRPAEVARGLVAPVQVLVHRTGDDGVHFVWKTGNDRRRARRSRVEVGVDLRDLAVGLERDAARQGVEEDAAERVDVRGRVAALSLDLLGRDVVDRADELAALGDVATAGDPLDEAEVREVDVLVAAARDQHVGGLDVPVDEAALVGGVECVRDLGDDARRPLRLEAAAAPDQGLEVRPLDPAHRDEERALGLPRLVDGDDVRMVDRGREQRLPLEALAEAVVVGQVRSDELQRHGALQRQLGRVVDDSHTAAPGEGLDPVSRHLRPGREFERRHVYNQMSRGSCMGGHVARLGTSPKAPYPEKVL